MNKIILVRFPYIDNPNKYKERPAFCLTKPIGKYKQIAISYITTNTNEFNDTDILIDPNHKNFNLTNLRQKSIIKLHKITTISLDNVLGEIGKLPEDLYKKLKNNLKLLFEI